MMNDMSEIVEVEIHGESFERSSADLEILRAAYPEEITFEGGFKEEDDELHQPTWFPLVFTLDLQHDINKFGATITMEFPIGYPMTKSLEVVSYRTSPSTKKEIIEEVVKSVKNTAQEALESYGGEECGLSCCAAAIDSWTTLIESEQQILIDRTRVTEEKLKLNAERMNDDDIHWITSEDTLVDRKSVFQAHLCVVTSEEMVKRAVDKLIRGSTKIQRASHNMYAYRFSETLSNGKTILKHDNDDDGEDAAGSRLAQLIDMRKEDGILILVSRWFGGTHLGPKRFAHITNVARNLLVTCHEDGSLTK